jgi:signal transduction histidine kinase
MNPARILLGEDDGPAALELRDSLVRLGHAVPAVAATAEEALRLAAELRPDLVLLDLLLPVPPDGAKTATRLRAELGIPAVFLAARADSRSLRRAAAAGPAGFVFEPANEVLLGAVVEAALTAERAHARAASGRKMEAVGQLTGGLAHAFNNLLTIINGYCGVLLASLGDDHPWHGFVHEIERAAGRATDLTRQLVAFSRRQMLQPRSLDLNAVVLGMEASLRGILGEGVELVTRLESGLSAVRADPGQLEQVLLQLAANARDAMPGGGRVTVESGGVVLTEADSSAHPGVPAGPYVRLRVSDTGHGMPEAVQARVFEPFFTTRVPGKNVGMGLASVWGIVRQSGGYIEVASAPGQGATFTVYLPPEPETAPPASPPSLLGLPMGTETILLVETDEAVRSLNRQVLRMCGYTVLEASHGVEALRVSSEYAGAVDLLVTEVATPGMGGRQLSALLSAQWPALRVLFLSPYRDTGRAAAGVDSAFLIKPYAPRDLARKVRDVLDSGQP